MAPDLGELCAYTVAALGRLVTPHLLTHLIYRPEAGRWRCLSTGELLASLPPGAKPLSEVDRG
jgi:hypothetical protein